MSIKSWTNSRVGFRNSALLMVSCQIRNNGRLKYNKKKLCVIQDSIGEVLYKLHEIDKKVNHLDTAINNLADQYIKMQQ